MSFIIKGPHFTEPVIFPSYLIYSGGNPQCASSELRPQPHLRWSREGLPCSQHGFRLLRQHWNVALPVWSDWWVLHSSDLVNQRRQAWQTLPGYFSFTLAQIALTEYPGILDLQAGRHRLILHTYKVPEFSQCRGIWKMPVPIVKRTSSFNFYL